ncbi:hypothetical protein VA596_41400 [Amycolatopsis sp., V23-08]|uniref:Uncharacterized protein n=1 Tax=Amycolatopsis heterodermiae TaxID=3110235 RepID=A0ABU5RID1_9PSEU|nr:hypothetical protein [Amycolatopsis sp., V23-08]MEA5366043.1 hypothetical protein [Amycolatopsis sp., V23-08]
MIGTQDSESDLEVTDSQIDGTSRLAAVHVKYGELRLPERIAGALADGPEIRVTISRARETRGVEHVTNVDAVRDGVKLSGIAWPEGVTKGTVVVLACNRRASLLHVFLPVTAVANQQLAADETGEATVEAPVIEPITDEAADAVAEVLADLADVEQPTQAWPVVADTDAQTEVFAAVATPGTDDEALVDTIGADYAAELADVLEHGMPYDDEVVDEQPRVRTGWLAFAWFHVVAWFASVVDAVASHVENVGQDVIDHARVVAKVVVLIIVTLILVGSGIGWWLA